VGRNFDRNVTKFASHVVLKLIAWCKLTFGERVVLHRVVVRCFPSGKHKSSGFRGWGAHVVVEVAAAGRARFLVLS